MTHIIKFQTFPAKMSITIHLYPYDSVRKIKKILNLIKYSNQISVAIPQIFITPPEPDKTEQEVALEKTIPTKALEVKPQTNNEIQSKHDATSQENIVLMEIKTCLEKKKT